MADVRIDTRSARVDVSATRGFPVAWRVTPPSALTFEAQPELVILGPDRSEQWRDVMRSDDPAWVAYLPASGSDGNTDRLLGRLFSWLMIVDGVRVIGGELLLSDIGIDGTNETGPVAHVSADGWVVETSTLADLSQGAAADVRYVADFMAADADGSSIANGGTDSTLVATIEGDVFTVDGPALAWPGGDGSNNTAETGDCTIGSNATSIDIRVWLRPGWANTVGSFVYLCSRYAGSGSRPFRFGLTSDPEVDFSIRGNDASGGGSSSGLPTDARAVRGTWDGTYVREWYLPATSDDWVMIGEQDGTSVLALDDTSEQIAIGARHNGDGQVTGGIWKVSIATEVDGDPVWEWDAERDMVGIDESATEIPVGVFPPDEPATATLILDRASAPNCPLFVVPDGVTYAINPDTSIVERVDQGSYDGDGEFYPIAPSAGAFDKDLWFDARRVPLNNMGTVDSLRATIEGDCVTVDGPAVGQPIPGAANSGFVTSGTVDIVGGATALIIELDLAEPFELARMASLTGSFYGPNQYGGGGARVFRALLQDDGDMVLGVSEDGTSTPDDVIGGTPVPDGARVLRWEWETGIGFTAKYAMTVGGAFTTLGTNGSSTGAVASLASGAVEEFGVMSRSANGDDPIPFMWSGCRIYADGVLVVDIRPDDLPDDSTATTITPTLGPALDRLAGDGNAADLTLVIPAGQSMIVNPDESDPGNRVSTGQGIVTTAAAVFNGDGTYLSVPAADAAAILNGASELDIQFGYTPADYSPGANEHVVSCWDSSSGDRAFTVLFLSSGVLRLQTELDDGSDSVAVDSDATAPDTYTAPEWRVTWDSSDGDVTMSVRESGDTEWTAITVDSGDLPGQTVVINDGGVDQPITFGARSDGASEATGVGRWVSIATTIGGTPELFYDESDLARGAEGESSFPASTGQTISVNGNVGWSVSEWGGVEPTATFDGVDDFESVPDEAAFDITGDLCIIAKVARTDWEAINGEMLFGKWQSNSYLRSYALGWYNVGNPRRLRFYWSEDGLAAPSLVGPTLSDPGDGVPMWLAITFDVDNGSSKAEVTFWEGGTGDAPEWTSVGSSESGSAYSSVYSSVTDLTIGCSSPAPTEPTDGSIPYVALYDGIGDNSAPGLGTKVFERTQADIARAASAGVGDGDTYPSASGHTVTSNGGVTYTGTAPLVIPSGTHALLGGTFVLGNQTGGFVSTPRLGSVVGGSPGFLRAYRDNDSDVTVGQVFGASSTPGVAFDPTDVAAYFTVIDRDADLLRNVMVDSGGTITTETADISGVGAIFVAEGITALEGLPGALGSLVFDKRTTAPYDVTADGEVATLGAALLAPFPYNDGDTWTALGAGTIDGEAFVAGDLLVADTDAETDPQIESGVTWLVNPTPNQITTNDGVTGGNASIGASGGDYESVPDDPAFDITGDVGLIALVRRLDWTPDSSRVVFSRWATSAATQAFELYVSTSGRFVWLWRDSDQASASSTATTAAHEADGDWVWIAVALDVDDEAGGRITRFWTADGDDPIPAWTQLGADVTAASPTDIQSVATELGIGGNGNGGGFAFGGDIAYVALYDGIGDMSAPGLGTLVFERTADDCARAAAAGIGDGDTYRSASGHQVTSHGGVTYSGSAPLVIPADRSAVLAVAMERGTRQPQDVPLVRLGQFADGPRLVIDLKDDTSDTEAIASDGTNTTTTGTGTFPATSYDLLMVVVDRTADVLRNIRFRSDGTVDEVTEPLGSVGAILPTEGFTMLEGLAGGWSRTVFRLADSIDTAALLVEGQRVLAGIRLPEVNVEAV